jgi:hypothetical protein
MSAYFSATGDPAASVEAEFAQWDTAYINDLPDNSFLYIEDGGKKDEEGKTTPRSLRHFPYKDADGKIDLPHLRNAIARIPQSNVPNKDALQRKAQGMLERANNSVDYQDLLEASEVLFAPARHQTPEGQAQIQQLHDLSARYGAVCKASNTAKMASSSEAKAIQGIHDAAMTAGAVCSKVGAGGMASPYFNSGVSCPPWLKKFGERRMSRLEEFVAWLKGDEGEGGGSGAAAPPPITTEQPKPKEATMSNDAKNEAQEREARLYAELAAEREKSARLERERIHERAVAFSDKTLKADKRILPASTEALTVLFEQLAIADNKMPAVTFSDGSTDTYVGLLSKFVATLPKSPLTEELLSGSLHETIVALANRQEAVTPDTDRQLSREELDAMLAKLPTGRSMLSERRKNGA